MEKKLSRNEWLTILGIVLTLSVGAVFWLVSPPELPMSPPAETSVWGVLLISCGMMLIFAFGRLLAKRAGKDDARIKQEQEVQHKAHLAEQAARERALTTRQRGLEVREIAVGTHTQIIQSGRAVTAWLDGNATMIDNKERLRVGGCVFNAGPEPVMLLGVSVDGLWINKTDFGDVRGEQKLSPPRRIASGETVGFAVQTRDPLGTFPRPLACVHKVNLAVKVDCGAGPVTPDNTPKGIAWCRVNVDTSQDGIDDPHPWILENT